MSAAPQYLLATTNPGKLREIRAMLAGLPVELVDLKEVPGVPPPDETGTTFAENARLKAVYYSRVTGLPAIADDSGLEIDALGGAPGVASARFGGEETSYSEKFALIHAALAEAGRATSPARFVCVAALADHGTVAFEAIGVIEGEIAARPAGTNGFGYDPIFFYPPLACTLAQVTAEQKGRVSHRGAAFRQVREFLERATVRGARLQPSVVEPGNST